MPEVEVRSDDDAPNVPGRAQAIDELVGGELRECVVETKDDDGVGARRAEQPNPVPDVRERGRRRARREHLDRQRVEGRGDGGGLLRARPACELCHKRAMPEMDAVEHADGEVDRPAWPAGEVSIGFDAPRLVRAPDSGGRGFHDGVRGRYDGSWEGRQWWWGR